MPLRGATTDGDGDAPTWIRRGAAALLHAAAGVVRSVADEARPTNHRRGRWPWHRLLN
jgi:hypothetical protein